MQPKILARYLHYQRKNGQPELNVQEADSLVDAEHGWLEAYSYVGVIDGSRRGRA